MTLIHALLSALLLTQAHASPATAKIDPREVAYYNSLSAKCGNNLLCYFSSAEIQQALGMTPAQALANGLLDESAAERFADEDMSDVADNAMYTPIDGELEFQARRGGVRSSRRGGRGGGGGSGASVVHALVGYHQSSGPIWGAFIATLKACKPGCVPKDYNCHRPASDGFSCHNFDRAIDVGAIVCNGHVDYAIDRGPFQDLVTCARKKGLKVLYMQPGNDLTVDHHNHGHFSLCCPNPRGGTYC